jgi:hypothetical protein
MRGAQQEADARQEAAASQDMDVLADRRRHCDRRRYLNERQRCCRWQAVGQPAKQERLDERQSRQTGGNGATSPMRWAQQEAEALRYHGRVICLR